MNIWLVLSIVDIAFGLFIWLLLYLFPETEIGPYRLKKIAVIVGCFAIIVGIVGVLLYM